MAIQQRLVTCLLALLAATMGWNAAQAQRRPSMQETIREVQRMWKEWDKALRKDQEKAEKDVRRATRPGSKDLPEGTTQHPGEFLVRKIRAEDLGVSLVNSGPGVVIEQIDPRRRLAKAGFQERDRILSIDEYPIRDERDFVKYLFADNVRFGRVGIVVLHDDDRLEEIHVAPEELLEEKSLGLSDPLARLGIEVGDRAGNDLRVADVLPQTPAAAAGLRRGDVILAFDDTEVKSAKELSDLVARAKPEPHVILVKRDQSERKLVVKLKEK